MEATDSNINGMEQQVPKYNSYKLICDPILIKGSNKVYRYDGVIPNDPNQPPMLLRDPRNSINIKLQQRTTLELEVPRLKIDHFYVCEPPAVEVTFKNLNDNINATFLANLICEFGSLDELHVYYHPLTHKHLGVARVVFQSVKAAKACIEKYNSYVVMGRRLHVFHDSFGEECRNLIEGYLSGKIEIPVFEPEEKTKPQTQQAIIPSFNSYEINKKCSMLSSGQCCSEINSLPDLVDDIPKTYEIEPSWEKFIQGTPPDWSSMSPQQLQALSSENPYFIYNHLIAAQMFKNNFDLNSNGASLPFSDSASEQSSSSYQKYDKHTNHNYKRRFEKIDADTENNSYYNNGYEKRNKFDNNDRFGYNNGPKRGRGRGGRSRGGRGRGERGRGGYNRDRYSFDQDSGYSSAKSEFTPSNNNYSNNTTSNDDECWDEQVVSNQNSMPNNIIKAATPQKEDDEDNWDDLVAPNCTTSTSTKVPLNIVSNNANIANDEEELWDDIVESNTSNHLKQNDSQESLCVELSDVLVPEDCNTNMNTNTSVSNNTNNEKLWNDLVAPDYNTKKSTKQNKTNDEEELWDEIVEANTFNHLKQNNNKVSACAELSDDLVEPKNTVSQKWDVPSTGSTWQQAEYSSSKVQTDEELWDDLLPELPLMQKITINDNNSKEDSVVHTVSEEIWDEDDFEPTVLSSTPYQYGENSNVKDVVMEDQEGNHITNISTNEITTVISEDSNHTSTELIATENVPLNEDRQLFPPGTDASDNDVWKQDFILLPPGTNKLDEDVWKQSSKYKRPGSILINSPKKRKYNMEKAAPETSEKDSYDIIKSESEYESESRKKIKLQYIDKYPVPSMYDRKLQTYDDDIYEN